MITLPKKEINNNMEEKSLVVGCRALELVLSHWTSLSVNGIKKWQDHERCKKAGNNDTLESKTQKRSQLLEDELKLTRQSLTHIDSRCVCMNMCMYYVIYVPSYLKKLKSSTRPRNLAVHLKETWSVYWPHTLRGWSVLSLWKSWYKIRVWWHYYKTTKIVLLGKNASVVKINCTDQEYF